MENWQTAYAYSQIRWMLQYYTNTIYTQNYLVRAKAVSSSCSDDVIVLSPPTFQVLALI